MIKNNIILLILIGCLSGCVSVSPKYKDIFQPMPIAPVWETYTKPPVIKKEGDNFIVTDEFVKKSLQQKRYLDKVERWKTINNIP
jgi:hypothetical protein